MSKLRISLKVFDTRTGKVELEKECHSWVLQFLPALASVHYFAPSAQYPDISGTPRSIPVSSFSGGAWVIPGIGVVTKGIVVGTGIGAESSTNFALGTLIAHGTLANQLSYGAGTFTEPAVSGTTSLFKFSRVVTNNSPTNPITVKEVGIYWLKTQSFCFARDLTGDIAIANGGGSKTFEFTVTVDNTS